MFFTATILALPLLAAAAPLVERQQVVPDLPAQADLVTAETAVKAYADKYSGRRGASNDYGDFINSLVPISNVLESTIGEDNVIAIDVLADRLCIAGQFQGSLCNELISYAYSWIVFQEKGKTYQQMAEILGPNNVKTLHDDMHVLCLGTEGYDQFSKELCQILLEDVDVLANSILGQSALSEDDTNSDSLAYFGLSKLLPKPQLLLS